MQTSYKLFYDQIKAVGCTKAVRTESYVIIKRKLYFATKMFHVMEIVGFLRPTFPNFILVYYTKLYIIVSFSVIVVIIYS